MGENPVAKRAFWRRGTRGALNAENPRILQACYRVNKVSIQIWKSSRVDKVSLSQNFRGYLIHPKNVQNNFEPLKFGVGPKIKYRIFFQKVQDNSNPQ